MKTYLLVGLSTFALGFGTAVYLAQPAVAQPANTSRSTPALQVIGEVLALVKERFVSPIDDKRLVAGAIGGVMMLLDDRSGYIDPETISSWVPTSGGNVGLLVESDEHGVRVTSAKDDSPAARAGLKAGDRIIAIDGATAAGMTRDRANDLLRGDVGKPVTLRITRPGSAAFDVNMVREAPPKLSAKSRMEGDYGYIRLTSLDEGATKAAQKALQELQAAHPAMKGLVLDLRSNPGGLVHEAGSLAGLFLDGGEVFSQRGRAPEDNDRQTAIPQGDRLRGLPIVVLINGDTVSGAEIVAGALQDRKRATVVGMTSFGAGTIGTVIPLRNGADGALKITTARVYTPSGRSFEGVGIAPDLPVASTVAEAKIPPRQRYSEASLPGGLGPEGGARAPVPSAPPEAPPSADYQGDYQLKRALDVLKSGAVEKRPAPVAGKTH